MEQALDIAEVARRTGLTSRALRFYESRGLLTPLRTQSGRRLYSVAALERIHLILALKRAGLSLAQIQRLTERRPLDLGRLIAAQLEALDGRAAEIAEAKALLLSVTSRIDRGEPVDAETFCSLIRHGDKAMAQDNWKKVVDAHYTPEEQADWAEKGKALPADFDQEAYGRAWSELSARIEAALPLDPRSERARAFHDEWRALLKPFTDVASPQMLAGAANLYGRMDEWKQVQQPPFPASVWQFMQEVGKARA